MNAITAKEVQDLVPTTHYAVEIRYWDGDSIIGEDCVERKSVARAISSLPKGCDGVSTHAYKLPPRKFHIKSRGLYTEEVVDWN